MDNNPILAPAFELADGDKTFYTDLLESMARSVPSDIAEIEKAIEQKHLTLVGRSAHHMKSSVMYTNADELKQLLSTIENKEEAPGVMEEIKKLMPELKQLAQELMDTINLEIKK